MSRLLKANCTFTVKDDAEAELIQRRMSELGRSLEKASPGSSSSAY